MAARVTGRMMPSPPTGPKPRWLSSRCMARMVSAPASSGRASGVWAVLAESGLSSAVRFVVWPVRGRLGGGASARAGFDWVASPATRRPGPCRPACRGHCRPPLPSAGQRCPVQRAPAVASCSPPYAYPHLDTRPIIGNRIVKELLANRCDLSARGDVAAPLRVPLFSRPADTIDKIRSKFAEECARPALRDLEVCALGLMHLADNTDTRGPAG